MGVVAGSGWPDGVACALTHLAPSAVQTSTKTPRPLSRMACEMVGASAVISIANSAILKVNRRAAWVQSIFKPARP